MDHALPRPTRRAAIAACAALAALAAGTPATAQTDTGYALGVVPYFSPSRLEEVYAPIAADLSRVVGKPVGFRTSSSWDRFYAQLKQQSFDILFVHALWYVPAADEFGYLPLARTGEPFTAVVVVPDASPIRSVDDLRGKTVATPPSYVPAVHLAKKSLRDRGLRGGRDLTFDETRTVDACLQAALTGAAQACVAPPFTVAAFQASNGVKLRTVLESPELPSTLFAVHKRVPEADRERLRAALLAWNESPAGRELMRRIPTRAMVAARNEDYDTVRNFLRQLDEPWRPSVP